MKYVLIYLACANLFSLFLMGFDKYKAIHHRWRISEAALFGAALIGGGLGSTMGMILFNHKTRHTSFRIGLPLILILQVVGLIVWAIAR